MHELLCNQANIFQIYMCANIVLPEMIYSRGHAQPWAVHAHIEYKLELAAYTSAIMEPA